MAKKHEKGVECDRKKSEASNQFQLVKDFVFSLRGR